MFDIGVGELLVILIVAVVVIGPKDLPLAMRTAGRWIGKMRRVSAHFRSGIDAMVREAGEAPDDFDAAHWFARWMADPVPALGGVAPQELLDTADGREAVSTLLYQMKSGVYA